MIWSPVLGVSMFWISTYFIALDILIKILDGLLTSNPNNAIRTSLRASKTDKKWESFEHLNLWWSEEDEIVRAPPLAGAPPWDS